jgi:ribonuclease D
LSNERPAQLIDIQEGWHAIAPALTTADSLAVDLEADGFHRYPEHVALVQIGLPDGRLFIVDPLAVDNLDLLGTVLSDDSKQKILHSADYDIRSFDRDFGFDLVGLFDTAIAAQFCGSERTGLGNVLAEYLDIHVPKPKRLQRLDWSLRPLPQEALAYAAGDVAHLHELHDALAARLTELGRTSWVAEECGRQEQVAYTPPDPPEVAYLSVRGARKLSGRSLAVLREVFLFREEEAVRIGQPPYRVMTNQALISLAGDPTANLGQIKGIRRSTLADARERLEQAVERGLQAEPVKLERHRGRNPWTPELRQRLGELKSWRNMESERLQLDRGVVWPAGHLDQLALNPGTPSRDLDSGEPRLVREWQWLHLGPSLEEYRRSVLGDPIRGEISSGL